MNIVLSYRTYPDNVYARDHREFWGETFRSESAFYEALEGQKTSDSSYIETVINANR